MVARSDIVDSIRGQVVLIPDIERLFVDWPRGKSSEEANVEKAVVDRLHTYVITTNTSHAVRFRQVPDTLHSILEPGLRLNKMKAARFGTSAACWWPDASCEALVFAANLVTWVCAACIRLIHNVDS